MTKAAWCAQLEGAISSGEKRLQGLAKELALYKVCSRCNASLPQGDYSMGQVLTGG